MFAQSRAAAVVAACSIVITAQHTAIGANDVVVNHGSLVFDDGKGHLDISGTESFALTADVGLTGGVFTGYSRCQGNECVPGTIVDLNATWFGLDLQGDAKLRGAAYSDVGELDGESSAHIDFSGTATMPAMSSAPVTILVPFTCHGFFASSLKRKNADSVMLSGSGTASLRLRPSADRTRWYFDHVVFQFEAGKAKRATNVIG
jgi:hypothetical protein